MLTNDTSRKRVLIFSLAPLSSVGGAEVAIKNITARLPKFEFEVIAADITNFWSKYWYPWWAYREARRRHFARPYDVVWAIMANQAGMAAAQFKRAFPQVPLLLTLQEGDEISSWAYQLRLWGPRLWRVFRAADAIQAISHFLARWARAMGARGSIVVVPNGVALEQFAPKAFAPGAQPVLITTSRLVRKNGVDTLIAALAQLPPNSSLQVVGTGPLEPELKEQAARLGVAERVKFIGALPPAAIAGALARADIFVRPSRSEGLGNSFLEAMAAGLPTIGTPVGGIPDFLHDGETGWLVPPDEPAALAQKIAFVLEPRNLERVRSVAHTARQLVEQKYDWNKIAAEMQKILSQLVCKKS